MAYQFHRKVSIAVFIFALAPALYLHADWGWYYVDYGAGGIPVPGQNKNIAMEKADILITAHEFAPDFTYQCSFTFKNITPTAQTVLMGFPIKNTVIGEAEFHENDLVDSFIENFTVTVNGSPQEVASYSNVQSGVPYNWLYTFTTTFKPKEEKSVVNSYRYRISETPGETPYVARGIRNIINYIITTGGLWAGPIGELSITITFQDMPYEIFAFKELETSGFVQRPMDHGSPNTVVLVFDKQQFEPQKEISLQYFSKDISDVLRDYIGRKNYGRAETLMDYCYGFEDRYGGVIWADELVYQRFSLYATIKTDAQRFADFWVANNVMYSKTDKAIHYYAKAFRFAQSNAAHITDPDILLLHSLTYWQKEAANDAPAYYIAYNLACCYSLIYDLPLAAKWLRLAIRLNPVLLKSRAGSDKDLANLRTDNALFKDVMDEEPAEPTIYNPAMESMIKKFDHLMSQLKSNPVSITANKVEVRDFSADDISCAVIIYYEAKTEGLIQVEFWQNSMHSAWLSGMGNVRAPAGRGLLLVPIAPATDDERLYGDEFYVTLITPQENVSVQFRFER
jgi:tetratricopeptide (TPR) repeat protein